MEQLNNPFVVYGYKGAEYFCDREKETKTIMNALHNERNIVLVAPRRIGKTGLIHHVFAEMAKTEPESKCFYMDINSTRSLTQFVHYFAKTVIGKLDSPTQSALRKASAFFSSFKPLMSFDEVNGTPSFSLTFSPDQKEESLKRIFDYIRLSEKRVYIAIDEFQQITQYPEKGTEALLRSYIQFLPNVYFIFAGSKQHMMADMFMSAKRPFYLGAQVMALPLINIDKYADFANRLMAKKDMRISKEDFTYLYQAMDGQTWYVQANLNRIYENGDTVTKSVIDSVIKDLINEQDGVFSTYYDSLTTNQALLLSAIAQAERVPYILSQEFISQYHLPATSSVNLALKSLIEKEFVYKESTGYIVYDRFFARWLRRKASEFGES